MLLDAIQQRVPSVAATSRKRAHNIFDGFRSEQHSQVKILCCSRSTSFSNMLARSGYSRPPCGVPCWRSATTPSYMMPAFRYARISRMMPASAIRFYNRSINTSWLTRSKNFSGSTSTTVR